MAVVAHRLGTVQNADIIFILGNGTVQEAGHHEALLRNRGVFYQMVSLLLESFDSDLASITKLGLPVSVSSLS